MSHSLGMMLQMAPKLDISIAQPDAGLDKAEDRVPTGIEPEELDTECMERMMFEVMHIKYAAVREAELTSALEPVQVDVDKFAV